jgi:hypothetical protein
MVERMEKGGNYIAAGIGSVHPQFFGFGSGATTEGLNLRRCGMRQPRLLQA